MLRFRAVSSLPERCRPECQPLFAELGFGDTTPDPQAWIHFTRYDKQVALYNGYYIYYTDRGEPLEFTIDVPPSHEHKLAFQWITKHGPIRSLITRGWIKDLSLQLDESHPLEQLAPLFLFMARNPSKVLRNFEADLHAVQAASEQGADA